jgi:DNA-binding NarL/FixJ family response regulator
LSTQCVIVFLLGSEKGVDLGAEQAAQGKISVVIADDHKAFREGLASLLGEEDDIQIVGAACNGAEAAKLAGELLPDVIVTDVAMPTMGGIEAIKQIGMVSPKTAFVVLSAFSYDSYVVAAVDAGASAYLLKTQGIEEIAEAIRSVHSGQMVFGSEVNTAIRRRVGSASSKSSTSREHPSPRELQLLILAGKGLGNKEIAARIGIGERTVQTHFHNVLAKLGTASRTEAVVTALSEGWITFEEIQAVVRQE